MNRRIRNTIFISPQFIRRGMTLSLTRDVGPSTTSRVSAFLTVKTLDTHYFKIWWACSMTGSIQHAYGVASLQVDARRWKAWKRQTRWKAWKRQTRWKAWKRQTRWKAVRSRTGRGAQTQRSSEMPV